MADTLTLRLMKESDLHDILRLIEGWYQAPIDPSVISPQTYVVTQDDRILATCSFYRVPMVNIAITDFYAVQKDLPDETRTIISALFVDFFQKLKTDLGLTAVMIHAPHEDFMRHVDFKTVHEGEQVKRLSFRP